MSDDKFTQQLRDLIKTSQDLHDQVYSEGQDLLIQTLDAVKKRADMLRLAGQKANADFIAHLKQIVGDVEGEQTPLPSAIPPQPPIPNGHMPYGRGGDFRTATQAVDRRGVN